MSKSKNVTIKEVAKHAGVGLGTVSRAINGSNEISLDTQRKVLKSIEELNYIPNRVAQSMRSQKYNNIAFIVNDISNIAFSQIAKGIQEHLNTLGYSLILCSTGETNEVDKVRSFLEGNKLDGIILSASREDDMVLRNLLLEMNIPVVTLDREIAGIPTALVTDYRASIMKATEYLISQGHRGIAMAIGTRKIRPTRVCIEGFQEAFHKNHLPCPDDFILEGDFSNQFGREVMTKLLPQIRTGQITAIISLNNNIFSGILQIIRERALDYPKDVSLITIEDSELTQLLKPAITVISRPLAEIGKKVSQFLIDYISNEDEREGMSPIVIPTEFVIRDSSQRVET